MFALVCIFHEPLANLCGQILAVTVCRSYTETKITNAAIHEGNKTIVEVAKRTDVKYLNTAEALADAEGFLREEYASDGCHLTPLGLDVELNYICTHMYPEVSP